MSKNTRCQPEPNDYVRRVQELRRSSAASPVDRALTRRMANDEAIVEQLDDYYENYVVDEELDLVHACKKGECLGHDW